MRRILVERARAKKRIKRGGERRRLGLFEVSDLALDDVPAELLALDDALTRFARVAPKQAELASLRLFGGLTLREASTVMGISTNTADRYWAFARPWLLSAMEGEL